MAEIDDRIKALRRQLDVDLGARIAAIEKHERTFLELVALERERDDGDPNTFRPKMEHY